MASEPTTENMKLAALQSQLEEHGRTHAEAIRRANAALADAQDRSYWLERWQVDLNELMRRPGASEARAALRAVRSVYRRLNRLRGQLRALPLRVNAVRGAVQEERRVAAAGAVDRFARTISPDPPMATPATDVLFDRLDPSVVPEVEARLSPAEAALWDSASPVAQRRLVLAFGAHHGVSGVLDPTGLRSAEPPPEIHAMERGSVAAGGSTYTADMVVEAIRESGFDLHPGLAALDFGCSSGRVVRVLAAAYPEIEWHGCDPLIGAVEWAQENLPGVAFVHGPEKPPLPYADDSLDLVFAISIWSHFGENTAIAWLAEMERLLRPRGRLLLTTHGPHSIAHAAANKRRHPAQLDEIERTLYRDGFWFANEFGAAGDHGLRDSEWGTAFFTPEWLLRHAGTSWQLRGYHPGRLQDNQDLYVLESR